MDRASEMRSAVECRRCIDAAYDFFSCIHPRFLLFILLRNHDAPFRFPSKHNRLIERTYVLEGQMTEVQHEVREIKQRLGK